MGKKGLEKTTYLDIFSGSDFLKAFKKIDSKTKLYYQKIFFDSMASKELCTFYLALFCIYCHFLRYRNWKLGTLFLTSD